VFYTYLYLREDGTPYYVGKGSRKRRALMPHRVGVPSQDRILWQEHPTEDDALFAERFLIAYYGREDLGRGRLLNLTDGGEQGPTGLVVPEHVRQKHRGPKSGKALAAIRAAIAKRGKWQQPHTEATKKKISQANKGRLSYCPPRLTHCKRGHEMAEDNIYLRQPKQGRSSSRSCKKCIVLRSEIYLRKK